jgi:hypothetical protein
MNRIDRTGTGIASLGRDEDQFLAHVALGERVVPPVISPATQARINQEMIAAGLDPNEYTVGSGMSINPITGLPEFGFFKKAFKSIKKVARKVAPVAALVPGVGTALGGVLGGLGGGIGSLVSSIPGAAKIGKFFNPIKGATGIFGGTIGPKIRRSIAGFFGGGIQPYTDAEIDQMLETMDPSVVQQMVDERNQQIKEMTFQTPKGIKTLGDALGFGGGSGLKDFYGVSSDAKELSAEKKLGPNLFGGLGGLGGGLGAAGLGGFLGKLAYDAARDRAGGLAVTPQVSMDALGRYQLASDLGTGGDRGQFGLTPKPAVLDIANMGQRQAFAVGGVAELDLRQGGESIGPGTGTSDDIPAMLSDGEFVMTAKATRGAGAFNMKKNKSGIELVKGGKPSREEGVENMRELMNIFESI